MIVIITMMWGFGSESRQHAAQRACRQNLEKIYVAMQIYANDFSGRLPANTNAQTSDEALDALVPHYTVDTSIFICPGGRDLGIAVGRIVCRAQNQLRLLHGTTLGRRATAADVRPANQHVVEADRRFRVFRHGQAAGQQPLQIRREFSFRRRPCGFTPPQLAFSLVTTQGVVLLNPKP